MDILSKLPARLKELMEEAEISGSQLADKIGIERAEIFKFLSSARLPSTATLIKLADCFHCTADYLMGLSDTLDDRVYKQRPPFNEQFNFLLEYFHSSKYGLEKHTGLAEATVDNWQKGKYEPTLESLCKLAKYFNCSVDFIVGREV